MENKNVIRWAFAVGGFTLMSRVLGLVRESLMANAFGTALSMSAFVVAFRIPNLFRALFGEGALSSALIPVFQETRVKEGDAEGWRLVRGVTTLVGAFLLAVIVLGIGGMSLALAHPSWLGEKWAELLPVLPLARIMLPYVFFICMAAVSMGVLNSCRQFSVAAFTPALLNIAWILSMLFFVPLAAGGTDAKMRVVAWTVLAAGVVQLAYQMPALWRTGWRPGLEAGWRNERVRRVFLLMGPSALGLAVNQVNVMITSLLALHASDFAPSALYYAERLVYLPQGILATSLATVLIAVLSDYAAHNQVAEMREAVRHGLRTLLFVMTPAAIGLFALSTPIVRLLYERGQFDAESTRMTVRALWFYAPGLMAFCLAKACVPAFYAQQDTRTPVLIAVRAVGICFACNIASIVFLPVGWRHAGMALSTVVAEVFNGGMLLRALGRRIGSLGLWQVARGWLGALAAAVPMGAVAWGVAEGVIWFGARKLLWMPVGVVLGLGVGLGMALGAAVYFGLARLFRLPELGFVREALQRTKKAKAPAAAS